MSLRMKTQYGYSLIDVIGICISVAFGIVARKVFRTNDDLTGLLVFFFGFMAPIMLGYIIMLFFKLKKLINKINIIKK